MPHLVVFVALGVWSSPAFKMWMRLSITMLAWRIRALLVSSTAPVGVSLKISI
jgi:hypothetical protein